MNAVLAEILTTSKVKAPDGSTVTVDHHIHADEGEALQALIRATRPRVTLEIGFAYGISTLYICEALDEVGGSRHIVIDPKQSDVWRNIGLFTVKRSGYGRLIELHQESSHRTLPILEQAGQRIDLALIDGWHTFDYVLLDFFYVDRLLNVGGVVVFDDTFFYPAIRKVARYVAKHRNYVPIGNDGTPLSLVRRRTLSIVLFVLQLPGLRLIAKRLLRPEILQPDCNLNLPSTNFIAFRKVADDLLGDGSVGTRRWDQHIEF
jgi:predicted O-methyltransferase YrrM